jgi:hypothetical protein
VPDEFINLAASLKEGLPDQAWAADLVKARRTEQRVHDPLSHCLPIEPIRLHTMPGPNKFVQAPGLLVIMNELGASYRQIFTDERPLPPDPNPTWNGYSPGKWDGDTLVVHTNGFRDGLWLDATGNPMTDTATVTERFRRVNYGPMEIEITVDDSKAYTRLWTIKLNQTLKLDTDLLDLYLQREREGCTPPVRQIKPSHQLNLNGSPSTPIAAAARPAPWCL